MSDDSSENDVESETESNQSDSGSASDNGDEEGDDKSTNTSESGNQNPAKKPKRVTLPQQGFKENIGGYKKYFSQSYEPKEWQDGQDDQDGQADRKYYLRNGAEGGFTANFSLWLNSDSDPESEETGSFTLQIKIDEDRYVVTGIEKIIRRSPRIYIIPKDTKLVNLSMTQKGKKAIASVETKSDIMIECRKNGGPNDFDIFQSSILDTGKEKHLSFLKQYDNETHRITKIIGNENIMFKDLAKLIHEDSFLKPFTACKFYYCSVYGPKTFENKWAQLIKNDIEEIQNTLAESLSAIILNKNGVDKTLTPIEGFFVRLQLDEGNIPDDDVKRVKVDIGVKTIQKNQAALTSEYVTYFKDILTSENIESIKQALMKKITKGSIEPLVQFRTLASSDGFQWTFDECCKILELYKKSKDAVKRPILESFKEIFKGNEENANLALCANMKKIAEDINTIDKFNIAVAPIEALPLQLTYNNTDKILESEKTNLVEDQVGQIEENVKAVLFSECPVAQILLNVPGLDTDGKSIAAVCAVKKLYPHQARVFALARLRALSSAKKDDTDLFKKQLKKNDDDTIFQGSGLLANHDTGSGKTLTSISIVLAFWDTLWKDENNEEQPWGCFIMSTANGVRFDNNIDKLSKLVIDYFGFYKVHYYPTWDDNKLIGWTYHDHDSGAAIFSEQYYNDNFKVKENMELPQLPFKSFKEMVAWLIQERMIKGTKATLLSPGEEVKDARNAFINRRLKTIDNGRPKSILMEFSKFGYDVKKNSPEEEVKAKQMQLAVRNNIQNLAERQSELHNKIVVPFIEGFMLNLESNIDFKEKVEDGQVVSQRNLNKAAKQKENKNAREQAFKEQPALFLPKDNPESFLEKYYNSYLIEDDKKKDEGKKTCIEELYPIFLKWVGDNHTEHSKIENIKQLYFRVLLNEAGNVHEARLIALLRQLKPLPDIIPKDTPPEKKAELQNATETRLINEQKLVEDIKADIRLCCDMICDFLDDMNFRDLKNGYKKISPEELTPINTETTEGEDIDNKPSATADSEEDDDDDEDAINDATTNAEKAPKTPIPKPNYLRMGGTAKKKLKHCVFILDEIHILAENEMLVNYNYAIDAMKNHRDPATTWVVGLTATPGNTSKDAGEIFDMICTGTTFSEAAAKQKAEEETDPLITAIDEELKNTLYISRASFLGTESPGFPKLEFEKHGILSTYAGCPMTKKLFITAFLKRYEKIKQFETRIESTKDKPGKDPYVSSVGTNDDNRTAWLDFYSSFGKVYQTPTNDGKQKFSHHTRESKTIEGNGKLYELNENKKMAFFRHTNLYIENSSDDFKDIKKKSIPPQQTPEQNYDTQFVTTLQSPVFKFTSASNTKYFIPTSKLLQVLNDILKHEFNSEHYITLQYYNFQKGREETNSADKIDSTNEQQEGPLDTITLNDIKKFVNRGPTVTKNIGASELNDSTKNAIISKTRETLIKLLKLTLQKKLLSTDDIPAMITEVIALLESLKNKNTFEPFKDKDKPIFLLNTLSDFCTNAQEQQTSAYSVTLLTALTETINFDSEDTTKITNLTTTLKVDEAQIQAMREQIQSRIDNAARGKELKEKERRERNQEYVESIKDSRMDSFETEDNKFETKQLSERGAAKKPPTPCECKAPTGKTYVYSSQIRAMQALALYLQHCSKHKLMFITSNDTNIDDIIHARNNHGIRYILFRGFTNSIVYPFKKCNPLKNSDAKNLHDNLMDSSKTYRDIGATVCPTGYSLDDYVNIDGELAPIVLATKTAFTGVDLKGISRLLLMDSFLNKIHLLQFIGRGPRLCSHANTKGKKVSLKCYFMQTVGEKGNTDDELEYAGVILDDDTNAALEMDPIEHTHKINQYWTQDLGYNSDTFLWKEAVANYNAFLNPYGQAVRAAALDSVNLPDQTRLNLYLETNPTTAYTPPPHDKSGLILDYLRQNDLVFEPYLNQLKKLKVDEETIEAFKTIKTDLADYLRKEITTDKISEKKLTESGLKEYIQKIRIEKLRDILHNDQHPLVLEIIFAKFMTQPVVTTEQKLKIDEIFENVIKEDVKETDKPAFRDLKNKIKGEIGTGKTQNRHVKVSFNIGPNEEWSGNTTTLTTFLDALKKIGITNNFKKGSDKSISQSSVDLTFDTPSLKDDTTVVAKGSEKSVDDST